MQQCVTNLGSHMLHYLASCNMMQGVARLVGTGQSGLGAVVCAVKGDSELVMVEVLVTLL